MIVLSLLLIFMVPQAWGSTSPYPNPDRQTMWNNLTDSIHTMGQTPQQTKRTLLQLHNKRARTRLDSINRDATAKNKARVQAWINSQNQQ